MGVGFAGECAGVRIVTVGGDGGVMDHCGFKVEAAIAEIEEVVNFLGGEVWGCAAEDFTL